MPLRGVRKVSTTTDATHTGQYESLLRPRGVVRATFLQFELSMRGQAVQVRKIWMWLRNKRDKNLNVCEIENRFAWGLRDAS
jgi:hypothetical protein